MRRIFSIAVAVSIALGMANSVLSQTNDDPFRQNSDPFSRIRVHSSSSDDAKLRRQVTDLKNELSQLKKGLLYQDAESKQWKKEASAKIVQMESEARQKDKELGERNAVHDRLISHLLSSENQNNQRLILNYISDLGQIQGESELVPFKLDSQTVEVLETLTLSEDAKTRRLAKGALAVFAPNAIELGFQKVTDQWAPMEPDSSAKIRRMLNSSWISFDFDETAIGDVLDQIMRQYKFGIQMESGIDRDQFVTFSGSGTLSDGLHSILAPIGMSYRVKNGILAILPTDHAELPASLIYNVRGLLTDKLGIEELKQLVEDRFEPTSTKTKSTVLDEYRLLVVASDHQQDQVAQFFATLAKGN